MKCCVVKIFVEQCVGASEEKYNLAQGSAVDLDESVSWVCKKVITLHCSGLMPCLHFTLEYQYNSVTYNCV